MGENRKTTKTRIAPKAVLKLLDIDHAKTAGLNSLILLKAQRRYPYTMDEFMEGYCSQRSPGDRAAS